MHECQCSPNLNTDSKKVEELGQVKAGEGWVGRYIFLPISFLHANAYLRDWYILSPQSSLVVKGNLSNDDGDVNENGKKAIGYIGKTTLHVHHAFFVHLFAVTARLRREYA